MPKLPPRAGRSTEDALTDAGIWRDDVRVVECRAAKRYPGGGRRRPGRAWMRDRDREDRHATANPYTEQAGGPHGTAIVSLIVASRIADKFRLTR